MFEETVNMCFCHLLPHERCTNFIFSITCQQVIRLINRNDGRDCISIFSYQPPVILFIVETKKFQFILIRMQIN